MFIRLNENGDIVRRKVVLDCSEDIPLTEQSHKDEVDINQIIKRHGIDMIQKTALLKSAEFEFDDVTGNDFQEAMFKITKAQETFDSLPSQIRKRFDNNPAAYLDFVQNADNANEMVELGLAQRTTINDPIRVEVTNPTTTNPETPPE